MLVTLKAGFFNQQGSRQIETKAPQEQEPETGSLEPWLAPWEMNDGVGIFDIK